MRRAAVLVAALLVGGCAGSAERGEPDVPAEDDLVATMEVKVTGDSVRLILHVTNAGEEPLALTFPSSQRHDFTVRTAAGEEIWRWSDGMAFLQAISRATLEPGESWDIEAVWDPGSRSGEFIATGMVTARDRDIRQTATFELE